MIWELVALCFVQSGCTVDKYYGLTFDSQTVCESVANSMNPGGLPITGEIPGKYENQEVWMCSPKHADISTRY